MKYVCSRHAWHYPVGPQKCGFPNCGAATLQIEEPDPKLDQISGKLDIAAEPEIAAQTMTETQTGAADQPVVDAGLQSSVVTAETGTRDSSEAVSATDRDGVEPDTRRVTVAESTEPLKIVTVSGHDQAGATDNAGKPADTITSSRETTQSGAKTISDQGIGSSIAGESARVETITSNVTHRTSLLEIEDKAKRDWVAGQSFAAKLIAFIKSRRSTKFGVPAAIGGIIMMVVAFLAQQPGHKPTTELASLPVSQVLLQQITPGGIMAEGERRWRVGLHDDAVLLFEEAARRGNGSADARLAALYDPTSTLDSGARLPADARAAARYYHESIQRGIDVAVPRERLRAALTAKAASGDTLSRLTLKDYWQ